ncbi:hypothetical protein HanIR_Chr15g0730401 [Helianthus annuus]|nr:hypothetical protein HanIR_Chr15g0730401 [Helianthus annuus]
MQIENEYTSHRKVQPVAIIDHYTHSIQIDYRYEQTNITNSVTETGRIRYG